MAKADTHIGKYRYKYHISQGVGTWVHRIHAVYLVI